MEEAVSRVAKGSAFLVAGQLASNLIALVAFTLIARSITKAEMGVATIMNFMIVLGMIVSGAGVPTSSVRFISEARGKGADYMVFIKASVLSRTILAMVFSSTLAILADLASTLLFGTNSYAPLFYLAAIGGALYGFTATFNNALVGLNAMKEVCASYVLSAVAGQSTALLLIWSGWGVFGYVSGWVVAGLTGSLVSGILLARAVVGKAPSGGSSVLATMKALLAFSAPILATNIANYIFTCFDMFALTNLGTPEELGMYSVAMKAYTVITAIPINIAMAIFPYYGEQYGREDEEAIRTATITISRYLSLLFTPVALGIAAVAGPILVIFAGEKYVGSTPILMVFGFFGALTALIPMMGFLLITYKRTKAYMAANLSSVLLSLSLAPLLIPCLGVLVGMAFVRAIALVLLLAFYILCTRHIASVDCRSFAKGLLGSSIMAIVVYLAQYWLQDPLLLPLYVLLGVLVYGACIKILRALSWDDVLFLSRALPGPLKRTALAVGRLLAYGGGEEG